TGWQLAAFFGIVLTCCLPWYVAVSWRVPEFAHHFFWQHHVVRFLSPFDHQRPIWFYGPILLGGLLPGSLLIFSLARFLFTTDDRLRERRCPKFGFMLLAAGWCVLFFSLSGCKL